MPLADTIFETCGSGHSSNIAVMGGSVAVLRFPGRSGAVKAPGTDAIEAKAKTRVEHKHSDEAALIRDRKSVV